MTPVATGIDKLCEKGAQWFKWGAGADVDAYCQALSKGHLEYLLRQVNAQLSGDAEKEEISDLLCDLEHDSFLRLFGAPETCRRIYLSEREPIADLKSYLREKAAIEKARLKTGAPPSVGGWSALGDLHFETGTDTRAGESFDPFVAPSLDGIVFDAASPYATSELTESNFRPKIGSAELFSDSELSECLQRVFLAIQSLKICCPTVFSFVAHHVKTIHPRKDRITPSFKGSSNMGINGRVVLYNPHEDFIDHSAIANSLVHEAIHIFLYLHEEQRPFIADEELAYNSRIQSPWSHKHIHLRAYVHATIVWYALFQFWHRQARTEYFSPLVRDHYLTFCKSGFEQQQAIKRLDTYRSDICPSLLELLEHLQSEMDRMS